MSNPRRANGARRDKLIARVRREESVCHLCEQWVDKRLPHGLPGSPEVDELIPVAHGGDPLARANCRLAHRQPMVQPEALAPATRDRQSTCDERGSEIRRERTTGSHQARRGGLTALAVTDAPCPLPPGSRSPLRP